MTDRQQIKKVETGLQFDVMNLNLVIKFITQEYFNNRIKTRTVKKDDYTRKSAEI